jgi:hypothetical protein
MHWSLVLVGLCALAAGSARGAEIPQELVTLGRIKAAMAVTLARQPNYTCVQQIERSQRLVPRRKFTLHDMVRLEVALVDGKEMYAWPGARKFEDTDLIDMVNDGAIGTGSFATFARALFLNSVATFKYVGPAEIRSRRTVQYDFAVPLLLSGYHIRNRKSDAVVAYHGSFWADPDSGDLVRLEIVADEIPPPIGITRAVDVMDYDRVLIGDSRFLLPVGAELVMTDAAGNENRNRTQFTSCRQYTGESVVKFAEAPVDEAVPLVPATPAVTETLDLPGGLTFQVRLTTDIDSSKSAVGDAITATLDENIKHKRQMLVRKGARLLGRIRRLQQQGNFTILDLQFTEFEADQVTGRLLARIDAANFVMPGQTLRMSPGNDLSVRAPRVPGVLLRGTQFRLRSGARLRLLTQPVPSPETDKHLTPAPLHK